MVRLVDNLGAITARVKPQFVATTRGNFIQRRQPNRRREIHANPIQFAWRHFGQAAIRGEPFDLAPFGIHRVNRVTLLLMRGPICCRTSIDRN